MGCWKIAKKERKKERVFRKIKICKERKTINKYKMAKKERKKERCTENDK